MAAMADPEGAWRAYEEGREARRKSEYARAEERFRMAARIARASRAWETLALAQLGNAKVAEQRGNYRAARRLLARALGTARKYGARPVEGMILHDMFSLAVNTGEYREAARRAEEAFEVYKFLRHRSLPRLAHDIGDYWIVIGDYGNALPVAHAVLPHLRLGEERRLVWANIARAAAATGQRERFEEACVEVDLLAGACSSEEHLARCLLETAEGAATLGLWDRAESRVLAALEVAVRRSEAAVRFQAEALLGHVRARRLVETESARSSARRSELAQSIVAALREPHYP